MTERIRKRFIELIKDLRILFHSPFDILLTVGGEDDFNERLIDNLRCRIDQLQDIRTVVVVPEEQQPVRQLGQAIVRELDVREK